MVQDGGGIAMSPYTIIAVSPRQYQRVLAQSARDWTEGFGPACPIATQPVRTETPYRFIYNGGESVALSGRHIRWVPL